MIAETIHILFKFLDVIPMVLSVLILTCVSYFVAEIISKMVKRFMPIRFDPAIRSFVPKATKMAIIVIGIIMSLSIAGMSATGITTTVGLGAVAIGMSLKDIFTNAIQGFMILTNHPFRLGDEITVGEHTGKVIKINLLHTKLEDNFASIVLIPNTKIFSEIVTVKKY